MKQIYMIRHCEAEGQAPDASLTAEGQRQAQELAKQLKNKPIDRIVSSPFSRAVDSIEPLAEQKEIPVEKDQRLKERILSGAPLEDWQECLKQSFEDLDICYEGGESGREAMTRGVSLLRELLDSSDDKIAVVTHGGLMALMLHHFDFRFGFSDWANLMNPDIYRLTFHNTIYPEIQRM
ncbi:MAG TPA: histidine phosphatase family protein [Bacillales bacterium]|nr:histidine phosphatase family protein [Bacillales bacterium]